MKYSTDTLDNNKSSFPEPEPTEEQFLEQFAALEDGLSLLQFHIRGISETQHSSAVLQNKCGDRLAL